MKTMINTRSEDPNEADDIILKDERFILER